ncbi:MAG: hypothetical protein ACI4ET_02445 [Bilifractor sp.]
MQKFRNPEDQTWAEALQYLGMECLYRKRSYKLNADICFIPDFVMDSPATVIVVASNNPSAGLYEIEEFQRKHSDILIVIAEDEGKFHALNEKRSNTFIKRCDFCGKVFFEKGEGSECPICKKNTSIIVLDGDKQMYFC